MKRKIILLMLILVSFFIILTGCGNNKDDASFELLIFSNAIPSTAGDSIVSIVQEEPNEYGFDYTAEIYPMNVNKISIELAARNGDIYFVQQAGVEHMIEPKGFYPLDEIANELSLTIPDEYKLEHPDTGETHIFAIPVTDKSHLLNELQFTPGEPVAAVIPNYSEKKDQAVEIIKYLLTQSH